MREAAFLKFDDPSVSNDFAENVFFTSNSSNKTLSLMWKTLATKSGRFTAVSPCLSAPVISGHDEFAVIVIKKSGLP